MRGPALRALLVAALSALVLTIHARPVGATLRWGADAEGGAPYVARDPHAPERVIGFEVEIAEGLARALGEPIEFVQYEFGSLLVGLERGDLDLVMNGVEVTPDRVERVRFTRPYFVYRLQLVVRADDARFPDFDACLRAGCLVGTLGDTAAERLLDTRAARKRIYDGQAEPYRDLAIARLDAVLLDGPVVKVWAAPDPRLRIAGAPFAPGRYAIAVAKGNVALAERLDRALGAMIDRGELRTIYERWGLWSEDQSALAAPAEAPAEAARAWTVARYLPLLLRAAAVTIAISFASMALAILLGLPIAAARLFGPPPLRLAAAAYVEFFRGIPVLLLLFVLYYGLPTLGLHLPAWGAAIAGFGLNYAAYEAEIYRAAIGAVPVGQWEAAASLGMGRGLAFRKVIFPQTIRFVLPPTTNDFVALFKDTSLVSVIAVVELTKQYQILAKSSMKYLELGLVTAAIYLVVSIPLGVLSRRLEAIASRGAS